MKGKSKSEVAQLCPTLSNPMLSGEELMLLNCGVGEDSLRVPWTAGRSNQSILKEISPEYSLEVEKEMATHSSVLAWRIPGRGEPGGPMSMGSHTVGHDLSDLAAAVLLERVRGSVRMLRWCLGSD